MKVPDDSSLGTPDLELIGFRLWIHGREFPDSWDFYDGNWLQVTVRYRSNAAVVWAQGSVLLVTDIARWLTECEQLYKTLEGEAALQPCEPNLLIHLHCPDRLGHVAMRLEITSDHLLESHVFHSEFDQSFLPSIISQCKTIVANYPIRGERA